MRRVLLAAFTLLASPALAQDGPVDPAAIQALLDKAIEEHTVFLNCSATMNAGQTFRDNWAESVEDTLPLLGEFGFPEKDALDFMSRASIDAMMMRKSTFIDVIAFCASHPDWEQKFYTLNYVVLPMALNRLR